MSGLLFLALLAVAAPGVATAPQQVSVDRPGHCERPRWSRDGRHLAYRRWRADTVEVNVLWDLVREERVLPRGVKAPSTVEARGDHPADPWTELSGPPDGVHPGQACRQLTWGPRVQPDAFVYACNDEQGYRLYGHRGAALPVPPGAAEPAFHAARDELAFVGGQGGVYRLACRRLGRSCGWGRHEPERLVGSADAAEWVRPLWLDEGRLLVERHISPREADLWVLDPGAGSGHRRLSRTPGVDRAASLSPKGSRVAWFVRPPHKGSSRNVRRHHLLVQSLDEDEPMVVAKDALLSEDGPAWTPDGQSLVYVRDDPKSADPLVRVSLAASIPKRRSTRVLASGTLSNRDPSVSAAADGSWRLAVSAVGQKGDDLRRSWRKIYVLALKP